ncbi:MAG: response regulator [Verrucomicrobia bacterium]|nr:response regulator [Verrucomicrobiota bacterium]
MDTQDVKILIADDDPGHVRLVIRNLQRGGLKNDILTFSTGREVLDFLNSLVHPPEEGESSSTIRGSYLLLLDIRMPDIDGVEVLRRIKSDTVLRKLPVTMLTTTDDPREITRCYELGCSQYIVKPVDYEKFAEIVRKFGMFVTLVRIPVV